MNYFFALGRPLLRGASLFALSAVLLFTTRSAFSGDLVVVGGEVVGATGVEVLGEVYNVSFVDGSCISVFDGCDDAAADFPFNLADSITASSALADVINNSPAPLPPANTYRGCSNASQCNIRTPGELSNPTTVSSGLLVIVSSGTAGSSGGTDNVGPEYDDPLRIYAAWTVAQNVPAMAPFGAAILGSVLWFVGWRKLRRKHYSAREHKQ